MDLTKLQQIYQVLTKTQRRRLKGYLAGRSISRLAREEGVSVTAIHFSLKAAVNRAKKRLKILQIP